MNYPMYEYVCYELAVCTQSPTTNGLSTISINPPNKFFAVSCAASVIITPQTPNPAKIPLILNPNLMITNKTATMYIITRINL